MSAESLPSFQQVARRCRDIAGYNCPLYSSVIDEAILEAHGFGSYDAQGTGTLRDVATGSKRLADRCENDVGGQEKDKDTIF